MREPAVRLKTILDESSELDLIALVYTPWHLAGAMALAHALYEEGRLQRGLIAIVPHARAGYLVSEESSSELPVEVRRIRRIHPIESRWLPVARLVARFGKGAPVVLATPHRPHVPATSLCLRMALRLWRPLQLVFLDEGLGTYRDVKHWVRSTRERDRRSPISSIQIPLVLASSFLRTGKAPIRRNLLKAKDDILQPDVAVAATYRSYFLARSAEYEKRTQRIHARPEPGAVIWLSQPNNSSVRERQECIAWVRDTGRALRSRGISLWVKLHPRESADEYAGSELSIVEDTGALEEILPILQPAAVIGRDSTGLVTAAVLYGLPAFSVSGLAPFRGHTGTQSGRELFVRLKHLVHSPTTDEGLLEQLEEHAGVARDGVLPGSFVAEGWARVDHG